MAAFGLGISTLANDVTTLYVTIGLLAGWFNAIDILTLILIASTCISKYRFRFRSDLSAGHRQCHVLLREKAFVCHWHCRLRIWNRHVHLCSINRSPHQNLLVEGSSAYHHGHHPKLHYLWSAVPSPGDGQASQEENDIRGRRGNG